MRTTSAYRPADTREATTTPATATEGLCHPPHITLSILGAVSLTVCGKPAAVGASCQRLLVLLALKGGQANRTHVAGLLWPDVSTGRANANLRSVLWRLQRCCADVVHASFSELRFAPEVIVDLDDVSTAAHRLMDRSLTLVIDELKDALRCNFSDDIAPELCDCEWLDVERERHRQLRLHAMEALSEHLIRAEWYGAAVDAALGAVRADPFRESAHQLLIRAHLAEGNRLEARRRYDAYRALLREELDLEPSEHFMQLLDGSGMTPIRSAPGAAVVHQGRI